MIQANDLRKGNLFNPIGRNTEVHLPHTLVILEVVELKLFKASYVLKGENPVYIEKLLEIPYTDMSPIPLSDEVLVKCGFEKAVIGQDLCHRRQYIRPLENSATHEVVIFVMDEFTDEFYVGIHRIDDGERLAITSVSHLHQLQNGWKFLTGEELNYTP